METYTLEQIADMGWLSPDEAAELHAAIADAAQEVAELAERYVDLEARIQRYEEDFASDRLVIQARLRSLEQEYRRFVTGDDIATH